MTGDAQSRLQVVFTYRPGIFVDFSVKGRVGVIRR